ncbi:hypothetical protein ACFXB3_01245 [Streptomyces sp. NPDC059447]|uniref:hypothetical protein n=1 Tax=Streptomyces sp. NPDC059447 TaxID=3346834 RepID=UPI0036A24D4F
MIRTTPPRPLDVSAVFPQLGPLARPAIRLHPRPGTTSPYVSSVGGPLLWPADEPWPYCDESHGWGELLDGEWIEREGRFPLLPIAQLYLRDVPLLRPPGRADLLQVLWCPFEHEPDEKPPTALHWRNAAEVTDVLAAPHGQYALDWDGYVPEPCVLAPEQITEYPDFLELGEELQQQLKDWSRWRAAGADVDASYAPYPQAFYGSHLAEAPGWKVGGWAPWGLTDPIARFCTVCGTEMGPLLTIASREWDGGTHCWIPYEDQALAALPGSNAANPPGVQVSKGNHLQLYVCPESPDHPHTTLIQ